MFDIERETDKSKSNTNALQKYLLLLPPGLTEQHRKVPCWYPIKPIVNSRLTVGSVGKAVRQSY